jgi:hypothetical protein
VYTTLYAGNGDDWESEYSSYNGSYTLQYGGDENPNHAVLIVGWDDDLVHDSGSGAWIVKNSWGTGWGDNGYFTIAYGSANIGMWSSYVDDWQDHDQTGAVLYYDEGGWNSSWGFGNPTAWGMCRFVPPEDGYLTRVEFWTNDVTTDIDVYIYDDFDGSSLSNLMASKLNAAFDQAGYHSVALDSCPALSSGDAVYAAVRFTNLSYTYPIVADTGANQTQTTYMSNNGSTWYDLGQTQNNDVAIRIRTTPSLALSADDDTDGQLPSRYSLSNNYPNPFNPSTVIDYSVERRSYVTITVFNVIGQEVRTLVNEVKPAGEHSTSWSGRDSNGRQVASGIYFYRMTAEDFVATRKMLFLK